MLGTSSVGMKAVAWVASKVLMLAAKMEVQMVLLLADKSVA